MLVLVASKDPEGALPSDRHFAVEGELVVPVVLDCPDTHCEVCSRAWFGLVSHAGTTTAMVADRPGVTEAELRRLIHDWLDDQGKVGLIVQAAEEGDYIVDGFPITDPVTAVADLVDVHVEMIRDICDGFPIGTVVSRMGTLVSERVSRRAA
jgi:hypothetical protein